jgi:hypothetical protein
MVLFTCVGFIVSSSALDIAKLITDFQAERHENSESALRHGLWDQLLKRLFKNEYTKFEAEFRITRLNESYRELYVDVIVRLKDTVDDPSVQIDTAMGARLYVPLLLVEMAKEPLSPRYSHKDECKLAVEMGAALFEQMNQCGHLGEAVVRKLRVYGLLIGLCDFEVVVVYPDFGVIEGKETSRTFAMIYQSSRSHWRFSLFGANTDTDSRKAAQFCCTVDERDCIFPPTSPIPNAPTKVPEPVMSAPSKERVDEAAKILKKDIDLFNLDDQSQSQSQSQSQQSHVKEPISMQTTPTVPRTRTHSTAFIESPQSQTASSSYTQASPVYLWTPPRQRQPSGRTKEPTPEYISFGNAELNLSSYCALVRVRDLVNELGAYLFKALKENPTPPRRGSPPDNFYYPDSLIPITPKSRPDQSSSTPSRDAHPPLAQYETASPLSRRKPRPSARHDAISTQHIGVNLSNEDEKKPVPQQHLSFWEDETGTIWANVSKKNSKYELAVYAHPLIQSSPFFPRLRESNVDANGTLHMTLQAVLSQRKYAEWYPKRWGTEKQQRLTLARITLDLMGALRTLHAAGFVHSDVSPNNVGFNVRLGVWQLYDFNQTLRIEESLAAHRFGGTKGFRSTQASTTRIFTPFDDYIALFNTCILGFPSCLLRYVRMVSDAFRALQDAFSDSSVPENVNVDECYLKAFQVFCEEFTCTDGGVLASDPSYVASVPLCNEIRGNVTQ